MKERFLSEFNIQYALLVSIFLAFILTGVVAYQYRILEKELKESEDHSLSTITQLDKELVVVKLERQSLTELSEYQQSVINSFQGQINNLGTTVGTLNKLAQTDKELLKKYSKVYFLNENYTPVKLIPIEDPYIFKNNGGNLLVHVDVWPYLKRLLDDARSNNIQLLVTSAFRSFDTQSSLKAEYRVVYGAGTANQFSADQGYSEHQLGTSIDFVTENTGVVFARFKSDPAYPWLQDNAYKYGFILSYPEGNNYYKFEPWHWRFVGVDLATMLHNESKHFYDLDQREIDSYLIKLFD